MGNVHVRVSFDNRTSHDLTLSNLSISKKRSILRVPAMTSAQFSARLADLKVQTRDAKTIVEYRAPKDTAAVPEQLHVEEVGGPQQQAKDQLVEIVAVEEPASARILIAHRAQFPDDLQLLWSSRPLVCGAFVKRMQQLAKLAGSSSMAHTTTQTGGHGPNGPTPASAVGPATTAVAVGIVQPAFTHLARQHAVCAEQGRGAEFIQQLFKRQPSAGPAVKGGVFERMHATSFNADAILKGSNARATVLANNGPTDVMVGVPGEQGTSFQMKSAANGGDLGQGVKDFVNTHGSTDTKFVGTSEHGGKQVTVAGGKTVTVQDRMQAHGVESRPMSKQELQQAVEKQTISRQSSLSPPRDELTSLFVSGAIAAGIRGIVSAVVHTQQHVRAKAAFDSGESNEMSDGWQVACDIATDAVEAGVQGFAQSSAAALIAYFAEAAATQAANAGNIARAHALRRLVSVPGLALVLSSSTAVYQTLQDLKLCHQGCITMQEVKRRAIANGINLAVSSIVGIAVSAIGGPIGVAVGVLVALAHSILEARWALARRSAFLLDHNARRQELYALAFEVLGLQRSTKASSQQAESEVRAVRQRYILVGRTYHADEHAGDPKLRAICKDLFAAVYQAYQLALQCLDEEQKQTHVDCKGRRNVHSSSKL